MVKNHVTTIRGLKETPQAIALRALRSITKSSNTIVQVTEVPSELLFGEKIDFHRWSMVLNDKALVELSAQKTSGKQFFLDCSSKSVSGMFHRFWQPSICDLGLLELNISAAVEITDYGITMVAHQSPELRALNISNCVKITDVGLREVALNCSKLLYLNISSCAGIEGNGILAVAESCSHLTKLVISKCTQIKNWSLQRIFRKCRKLEHVKVSHMKEITDEEVRILAEHCHDLLSFIAVECPYLSDQCILSLTQNCRDLDTIDFSRTDMTYRISDVALMALGQRAQSLRVLRLNNCDSITDVGLGWLSEGCKVLEILEVYGCKKVTDAGLRVLGANCHALTELDVSYAKSVSDVGLAALARGCRALKNLRCPGMFFLSDPRIVPMTSSDAKTRELLWEEHIGVMALCHHCPQLTALDLSGCFRLNKVFAHGLTALPNLQQLNLSGCNQVTAPSLIAVAAHCHELQQLTLSDCGKGVNNEVLLALSQNCPKLQRLICARCPEIRGMGVKAVANMRHLEILDLSGCTALTDSMLVHLSALDKAPQLRELHLTQLPKITDSIIAWIAMKDHKLIVVNVLGCQHISAKALLSVRDRFPDSDVVLPPQEHSFFGFRPKPRVADRILVNSYQKMLIGITKIQARVRKMRACLRVRNLQHTTYTEACRAVLQRVSRGYIARCRVRQIRRQRQRFQQAAIWIATLFRRVVAQRRVKRLRHRLHLLMLHQRATQLQLLWRCFRDRRRLQRLRQARDQRHHRRVQATIVVQSLARMYLGKIRAWRYRELLRMRDRVLYARANCIQRAYRGFHARLLTKQYQQYLETMRHVRLVSVLLIQRRFRLYRTRLIVQHRAQERRQKLQKVVSIQALMRGALARLHVMELQYERGLITRRLAAIKIQCLWRVFQARSTFFDMLKVRRQQRLLQETAATIITRAARMKLAWNTFLSKRRAYRLRLTQEAARVLQAATKIQALIRRFLARCGYFKRVATKKAQWKELYDEEKQQRFFYNKQTGEIRWRIPQDLLDLLPHPNCDNCSRCEAVLECQVCNELFCGDCFTAVHRGGRRQAHQYRALYDFYGKRLDYGDGDFPCQWPSEVIQDEVQGWMLRVAPHRPPHRIFAKSGWEEYVWDRDDPDPASQRKSKSLLGPPMEQRRVHASMGSEPPQVFYFNRQTFATSYEVPPEVAAELAPPQPPEEFNNQQQQMYYTQGYQSQQLQLQLQQQQQQMYMSQQLQYMSQQQQQQYLSNTGGDGLNASYSSLDPQSQYFLQLAMGTRSAPGTSGGPAQQQTTGGLGYNNSNGYMMTASNSNSNGGGGEDYSNQGYYDEAGSWVWYPHILEAYYAQQAYEQQQLQQQQEQEAYDQQVQYEQELIRQQQLQAERQQREEEEAAQRLLLEQMQQSPVATRSVRTDAAVLGRQGPPEEALKGRGGGGGGGGDMSGRFSDDDAGRSDSQSAYSDIHDLLDEPDDDYEATKDEDEEDVDEEEEEEEEEEDRPVHRGRYRARDLPPHGQSKKQQSNKGSRTQPQQKQHVYRSYNAADLSQQQQQIQQQMQPQQGSYPHPEHYYHDLSSDTGSAV